MKDGNCSVKNLLMNHDEHCIAWDFTINSLLIKHWHRRLKPSPWEINFLISKFNKTVFINHNFKICCFDFNLQFFKFTCHISLFQLQLQKQMVRNRLTCAWTRPHIHCIDFPFTIRSKIFTNINQVSFSAQNTQHKSFLVYIHSIESGVGITHVSIHFIKCDEIWNHSKKESCCLTVVVFFYYFVTGLFTDPTESITFLRRGKLFIVDISIVYVLK